MHTNVAMFPIRLNAIMDGIGQRKEQRLAGSGGPQTTKTFERERSRNRGGTILLERGGARRKGTGGQETQTKCRWWKIIFVFSLLSFRCRNDKLPFSKMHVPRNGSVFEFDAHRTEIHCFVSFGCSFLMSVFSGMTTEERNSESDFKSRGTGMRKVERVGRGCTCCWLLSLGKPPVSGSGF